MLYEIENFNGVNVYIFKSIPLKLKVIEKNDIFEIFLNYKGYNLVSTMMFWNFHEECETVGIIIKTEVLKKYKTNSMYFIINKCDLDVFLEEIYCFFMENNMDQLCSEEKKYEEMW